MKLRKDDKNQAPLQAPQEPIKEHPLLSGSTTVGMVSGEAPRFQANATGHAAMGKAIQELGLKAQERDGFYGGPEKSYMVYGPTREQMYHLGKHFGQESVVYSQGGKHELLYTNGANAGKFHPGLDHEWFQKPPEDYYTHMPEHGGYLRLNFDYDRLHDSNLHQPEAVSALESRASVKKSEHSVAEIKAALAQVLRKALVPQVKVQPHPNAYPWHNEHTDHHLQVMSPGVCLRSSTLAKADVHPHMDGSRPPQGTEHLEPPAHATNEQAAGVGTSTYAKYALPFGQLDKQNPTDLFHYPYHGKNEAIDKLVKDHGYTPYYAGGKYGRPDLANRNYNTKHLMIYDPSPEAGASFGTEAYTDGWRKIHELAHALTHQDLNKIYGEGRRIGKLGHHRSMREALRAVHWEHLAADKQRELSKQIGVHIPDHVFNKEKNTVMHDAIHRAVTGKFTEPSGEGFKPHDHQIPLETSLGMVREAGHNLGLTGMHDLIHKAEGNMSMADEKEYEFSEARHLLAKAVKDRVDAYSKTLLELRQRELKKSLDPAAAPPAAIPPAPAMVPQAAAPAQDLCPTCGKADMPGSCVCLGVPNIMPSPLAAPAPGMPPPGQPLAQSEMAQDGDGAGMAMNEMADGSMCKSCGKAHGMAKCGLNEIKPMKKDEKKPDTRTVKCGKCGASKPRADSGQHMCNDCFDKQKTAKAELSATPKEPIKAAAGNGVKIKKLNKDEMVAKASTPGAVPPPGKTAALTPSLAPPKSPTVGKPGMAKAVDKIVVHGDKKPTSPPKDADYSAKKDGNKTVYQAKPMTKAAMPGTKGGDALQAAHAAAPAAAPAAKVKLPGQAAQATRQAAFASQMPAAPAAKPAIHNLTGLAKIKANLAAPMAGVGVAPKPAGPPAGTAHLAAPPPAPVTGPGAGKGGAPTAPPKLPGAAKPVATKPLAPAAKAAIEKNDLKKSLGNCPLCSGPEHVGDCS